MPAVVGNEREVPLGRFEEAGVVAGQLQQARTGFERLDYGSGLVVGVVWWVVGVDKVVMELRVAVELVMVDVVVVDGTSVVDSGIGEPAVAESGLVVALAEMSVLVDFDSVVADEFVVDVVAVVVVGVFVVVVDVVLVEMSVVAVFEVDFDAMADGMLVDELVLVVEAVADVEVDVVNMSLVEVVFVLPVAPFPLHNCPLYFHLVSRTLHWRHTVT